MATEPTTRRCRAQGLEFPRGVGGFGTAGEQPAVDVVPANGAKRARRTSSVPDVDSRSHLTAPYSAGPAPWHLYRLTLHTAIGVATTEPHGATRWDFAH
jgi:hypothetical protein